MKERDFKVPVERLLFALVAQRALAPDSKLALESWLQDEVHVDGLPGVEVQQLYRAMDFLLEAHDDIQKEMFFHVEASVVNLEQPRPRGPVVLQLHEIERVYRDLKHTVDVRPVYHHRSDRIKAHVLLCWLALLLIGIAETETGQTWHQLKKVMRPLMLGLHDTEHGLLTQTSKLTTQQKSVLGALRVKPPARYPDLPSPKKPKNLEAQTRSSRHRHFQHL